MKKISLYVMFAALLLANTEEASPKEQVEPNAEASTKTESIAIQDERERFEKELERLNKDKDKVPDLDLQNLKSPFVGDVQKSSKEAEEAKRAQEQKQIDLPPPEPKPSFKLRAIINNYALVDKRWLRAGDLIDDIYYLVKIEGNRILVKSKNTQKPSYVGLSKNKDEENVQIYIK